MDPKGLESKELTLLGLSGIRKPKTRLIHYPALEGKFVTFEEEMVIKTFLTLGEKMLY